MVNSITTTVCGNLTATPELTRLADGQAVTNFTIASTPRIYDKKTGEWIDGETVFLRTTAWSETAENVVASLHKGDRVIATGSIIQKKYTKKDGTPGTSTELQLKEIGSSLRYAIAAPTKSPRSTTATVPVVSPTQPFQQPEQKPSGTENQPSLVEEAARSGLAAYTRRNGSGSANDPT
ncbi:single-stranded DNA-binding protein [Acaricomes phytoseiuli]|uniref:single-stranded DNA-binding protein n=1 Tax=Acaricomes phytoseiuli TaxID=291968 RepID=UPI0022225C09|nr:single-stranded DNA-binding protein [Acaricomes phytoseiuli]MCW1250549.1 single-stranded DNA-binding protein [Acaricomes phytoseiuli]